MKHDFKSFSAAINEAYEGFEVNSDNHEAFLCIGGDVHESFTRGRGTGEDIVIAIIHEMENDPVIAQMLSMAVDCYNHLQEQKAEEQPQKMRS